MTDLPIDLHLLKLTQSFTRCGLLCPSRWAGRARLRVSIASNFRPWMLARSAVAVLRSSDHLRATMRAFCSGGGERRRRGGSAMAGGVGQRTSPDPGREVVGPGGGASRGPAVTRPKVTETAFLSALKLRCAEGRPGCRTRGAISPSILLGQRDAAGDRGERKNRE